MSQKRRANRANRESIDSVRCRPLETRSAANAGSAVGCSRPVTPLLLRLIAAPLRYMCGGSGGVTGSGSQLLQPPLLEGIMLCMDAKLHVHGFLKTPLPAMLDRQGRRRGRNGRRPFLWPSSSVCLSLCVCRSLCLGSTVCL